MVINIYRNDSLYFLKYYSTILCYDSPRLVSRQNNTEDKERNKQREMTESDSKKVEEALRRSGVLGKLEAMTKQAIVRQLKNDGAKDELARTAELQKVLASQHGRVALAMAIDLLDYCGLNYTTTVLEDECGQDCRMERGSIMKHIGDAKTVPEDPALLYILAASADGEGKDEDESPPRKPADTTPPIAPPIVNQKNSSPPTSPPVAQMSVDPVAAPSSLAAGGIPKTATRIGGAQDDEDKYSSFSDD